VAEAVVVSGREMVVEDDGDVVAAGNISGGGGRAEAGGQFSGDVAHVSDSLD